METFLYILLIITSLTLMVIVLIQAGKGSGVGLSIGGGMSQTMFGGSGGKTFFMKVTTAVGALFMLLCLVLAVMSAKSANSFGNVLGATPPKPLQAPGQPAAGQALPIAPAGQPVQPQPAKADAVPAPKPAAKPAAAAPAPAAQPKSK